LRIMCDPTCKRYKVLKPGRHGGYNPLGMTE
jgi:hypothetical protein